MEPSELSDMIGRLEKIRPGVGRLLLATSSSLSADFENAINTFFEGSELIRDPLTELHLLSSIDGVLSSKDSFAEKSKRLAELASERVETSKSAGQFTRIVSEAKPVEAPHFGPDPLKIDPFYGSRVERVPPESILRRPVAPVRRPPLPRR
jgi:hypothetical protein